MKQYGKIKTALAAVLCSCCILGGTAVAADGPIELTGDVIEYDARTDMAKATGGVKVTRDGRCGSRERKLRTISKRRKSQ